MAIRIDYDTAGLPVATLAEQVRSRIGTVAANDVRQSATGFFGPYTSGTLLLAEGPVPLGAVQASLRALADEYAEAGGYLKAAAREG